MIKITIPNNNINERKYIIDIIFNEILGVDFKLIVGNGEINDWFIELENGNKLIIEDHFFNKFPKDLEYLKEKNIPQKVEFCKNEFLVEEDIPVIYGINKPIPHNKSTITCSIDIFASSFFMLTRWEEYANKHRDLHNRFSATESLAFKNNFLDRPIVNEYVEMLWNMLLELNINQERKTKNYQLILTHDVDDILLFRTYKDLIRRVGGDIIRRKNPILATQTIWDYIQVRLAKKNDPYDTFDWLMDVSESIGVKSHFFFMAKGKTSYDNRYNTDSAFVKKLIEKIKKRGHYIGIHPTYDAYNDFEQFKKEKEELEKNLDINITFGREHYLRFEIPTTWQVWEDNGMKWDSTVGYADKSGFRCGTGDMFSVFNILTRKKLNLKEKPLIIMEATFFTYQHNIKPEEMQKQIKFFIKKTKKYKCKFVFLWHNSNLENGLKKIYERSILK